MSINKLTIFLGILASIFIGSIIINILLPQTEIEESIVHTNQTNFSKIIFSGNAPDIPEQMLIANIQQNQVNTTQTKQTIINALNLEQHPQSNKLWLNSDWSLNITNGDSFIISSQQYLLPTGTVSLDYALKKSQEFLDRYFPELAVEANLKNVKYLEGNNEVPQKKPSNQAQIIELEYSYSINGFPIYNQLNNKPPFVFSVVNNRIQKVVVSPLFIQIQPTIQVDTISIDKALSNINDLNKGELIFSEVYNPFAEINLNNIVSGNMTSVQLEYRTDLEAGLAYPFYRFSGTAIDVNNQSINTEIITPAINTTATQN
jgi:hypothetical protein